MIAEIALIIGAYLLGSFPYMLLLSRAKGFDFTHEPDFHLAMYRKVGRLEGLSGIAVDCLKGIIPVLIGYFLNFSLWVTSFAAVAAVVGQMWPIFQKFDGEKGNTTGLGADLALGICYSTIWFFLIGGFIMICGFFIRTIPRMMKEKNLDERLKLGGPPSNSLPIAMIVGFAAMPLVSWLFGYPIELTIPLLVIFVIIVIRRLTAKLRSDIKEPKTGVCRILFNRLFLDRSYL
jgi:acyl phosphate:glycerol-3-phosphate acyltransferase